MRTSGRNACAMLFAATMLLAAVPADQAEAANAQRAKPSAQAAPAPSAAAQASARKQAAARKAVVAAPVRASRVHHAAYRGPVLQCVVFARDISGIHLSGNAHTWWYNAAGRFARGQRPEVGAVLNFRASGGMRLGHVSVVSRVVSAREILVDDANWAAPGQRKGMIRRGASVIDVSPANDWTEVRVANGIGSWGRVYPTFGFIYPRADRDADTRIEIAAAPAAAPRTEMARALPHGSPTRGSAPVATNASGGWVWSGSVATPAGAELAAASPAAPRLQTQAPAPRAASPVLGAQPRWVWQGGRAVALD